MSFNLKKIFRKYSCSSNWNIGFTNCSPEELISTKRLSRIRWMKHPFKDRFFADPFILNVSKDIITILVEECKFEDPKGIIVELDVDRKSMRMLKRTVLLEKNTHLSYPAIIRYEDKIYVYPENGASGQLNIYKYDNATLKDPICILNVAVADSTIVNFDNLFYMVTSHYPNTQNEVFLYASKSPLTLFKLDKDTPIQKDISCSRPAGNWIIVGDNYYRPSQDCKKRYGSAIAVMKVYPNCNFKEEKLFTLEPNSFRYNRGIHTLNFYNDICVVDGYGYLYPLLGRILNVIIKLINKAK